MFAHAGLCHMALKSVIDNPADVVGRFSVRHVDSTSCEQDGSVSLTELEFAIIKT